MGHWLQEMLAAAGMLIFVASTLVLAFAGQAMLGA